MMMLPKKKIATVIMASLAKKAEGPKEEPVSNEEPESDNSIALEASADAVMQAIESKDIQGLAAALSEFMEICSYKSEAPKAE